MKAPSSTADDILACARTLIVTGGYNGFSYADIAEVVGIRKASIHHHFPTKAVLVQTLVNRYRHEAKAGLVALEQSGLPAIEQLRSYLAYWQGCIAEPSTSICVCALLASELPALPNEVALEVRSHVRSLSAWLTSVFERGEIRLSGPASAEAETFMATVHGGMLSARAYSDPTMFRTITLPLLDRLSS